MSVETKAPEIPPEIWFLAEGDGVGWIRVSDLGGDQGDVDPPMAYFSETQADEAAAFVSDVYDIAATPVRVK